MMIPRCLSVCLCKVPQFKKGIFIVIFSTDTFVKSKEILVIRQLSVQNLLSRGARHYLRN
jgi:hypothetical protein